MATNPYRNCMKSRSRTICLGEGQARAMTSRCLRQRRIKLNASCIRCSMFGPSTSVMFQFLRPCVFQFPTGLLYCAPCPWTVKCLYLLVVRSRLCVCLFVLLVFVVCHHRRCRGKKQSTHRHRNTCHVDNSCTSFECRFDARAVFLSITCVGP